MKSRFIGQDPEGKKRRGQQRIRWLNGIADPTDMSLSKFWERWWRTGKPDMLQSTGSQRVGHNLVTKQQEHKDALRLSRRPQVKIQEKSYKSAAKAEIHQSGIPPRTWGTLLRWKLVTHYQVQGPSQIISNQHLSSFSRMSQGGLRDLSAFSELGGAGNTT